MLVTEHTLLRMFLNFWRQILFSGNLPDDALNPIRPGADSATGVSLLIAAVPRMLRC